jgi:Secretion system C-terminal sorting domain
MFKKVILILFFLHFQNSSQAQVNLVPDGSFEDTTFNGMSFWGEGSLKHWHTLDSSYFVNWWQIFSINQKLDTVSFKLPHNQFFNQYPKHGNNIVGLVVLNKEPLPHTYLIDRSVIRSKLNSKLEAGKQYCATIYVNAWEHFGTFFTNGVGMYFDNGSMDTIFRIHKDSSGYFPGAVPQVQCNFLINDTANWMKVQGSFIANGSEEFITINNFQTDSNTLQILNNFLVNGNGGNINIDNVSLIPLDIQNWLWPTFYNSVHDSVWVGLDTFDYADGKWYTGNMQYITTGPGFWLKAPYDGVKKFIHEIDVCGQLKYDTTELIEAPLISEQLIMNNAALKVFPNPASASVTVAINKVLSKKTEIQIFDATGRVVYSIVPTENYTNINTSSFAKGLYVVRYGSGNVRLVVNSVW